jgi:hypothetical protein
VSGTLGVTGNTTVGSLFVRGSQAIATQGSYLQWNRDGGRTFLVNQKGLGGGGISFGEATTADVYTENMALSSTGNLTVVGSVTANLFSGNGSGLTNLNASNFTTGTLPVARGGTGLSTVATNGQLLIGNGTGYTLGTLTGTANQVNVTNGAGAITLSLPQAIATTSSPTFGGMTVNGELSFNNVLGDKLNLFTGYGFGINSSNLTAYVPSATTRFSVRTGGASTGTEVFSVTGGGNTTVSGNVALNTSGFAGNTSMRDLRLYSSTSVATHDHLQVRVDGSSTIFNAGGADTGIIFNVGNGGAPGDVGSQTYNKVLTLAPDQSATFTGAVNALSFAGDGSALTNLNANNFTTGTLPVARGGTGLSTAATNGQLLIGNGTGYTLRTLTGTANQVNVTNGAGTITLSLPQAIATTSTPTFGGMTLNGGATVNNSTITFNDVIGDKLNLYSGFGFGINGNNLTAYIPAGGNRFSVRSGGTYTGTEVFSVSAGGNATVSGTLGVTGNTTLTGALAANGGLTSTTGIFSGAVTTGGLLTANAGMQLATGSSFRFGGFNENTDDITMTRIYGALDVSLLRLSIGDNAGSFENDQFQLGSGAGGGFVGRFFVAPGTGDVIANGYMQATSFNATSDRRLKQNITAQENNSVLERLEQLQTYSYDYINTPSVGRRIGVIAQEIQNLFPEAVSTSAKTGMLSVDYNALGAMAAMGVGQLNSKFKVLDGKVTLQGEKLIELDGKLVQHDTRIGSLENWKTAAVTRMDSMQNAIDLNIQKIADNAVAIQTNAKAIERLDDALFTLDGTVKGNTESIANINTRWARNFSAAEDGSTLTVNAVELKVSNFTAQQIRANSVYTQRLEAEIARIADLEVNNLRANSAVANTVQAEQVNTGSVQVYAGVGMPAVLFAAKADGHYTVSTSALDGSYATATVIVNAGQAKVVSGASEGIELVAEGNMVKAIAAGKSIKASWIKMG